MKINNLRISENLILTISMICCGVVLMASSLPHKNVDEVPYPEGFRKWSHVKTVLIQKGNPAFAHWGGFHHIYGNSKAIEGYKNGKFEDGSVIVFDVIEAT